MAFAPKETSKLETISRRIGQGADANHEAF
jgi:hypothetical protein